MPNLSTFRTVHTWMQISERRMYIKKLEIAGRTVRRKRLHRHIWLTIPTANMFTSLQGLPGCSISPRLPLHLRTLRTVHTHTHTDRDGTLYGTVVLVCQTTQKLTLQWMTEWLFKVFWQFSIHLREQEGRNQSYIARPHETWKKTEQEKTTYVPFLNCSADCLGKVHCAQALADFSLDFLQPGSGQRQVFSAIN